MAQIFGPVPSRRLGFSLGIDVVTPKTCTLDCIYCQLGKTTNKTVHRKQYVDSNSVLQELKKRIARGGERIDYITFSGSGEPTLHAGLGDMIEEIKRITCIPVAVITNGTLLSDSNIREELQEAELVIPSLDAPDQETFQKINRPHPSLKFEEVVRGIIGFSHSFTGKIWLEIMLIKGMNDSREQIEKFAHIAGKMKLEKIQLNTPVRPPAEEFVNPATLFSLNKAKSILGERCQIIAEFKRPQQKAYSKDLQQAMLTMIKRRPLSLKDLSASLGVHPNEVVKYLQVLKEKKLIKSTTHDSTTYYLPS